MGAVESLNAQQRAVASHVQSQLAKFWALYGDLPADELRDALLAFVPALGERYGDVVAVAAAEWFEREFLKATGTRAQAVLGSIDKAVLLDSVRWAADDLYHGSPLDTWRKLETSLLTQVNKAAKRTVRESAARYGASYARVPTGAKTCAFCTMIASQGFVYESEAAAGKVDLYHDNCDCQIVPDFSMSARQRAAYDKRVDEMYRLYEQGREAAGSGSQADILAAMRRLSPESFTDGVAS